MLSKLFITIILFSGWLIAAGIDPVAVLQKKDSELQSTLRKSTKASGEARAKEIKTLINGIFDFEELGKKALGEVAYKKLTAAEQKKFVAAFKEMIENSSLKQIELYKTDSTRYEAAKIISGGEKASVTAHAYSKGQMSVLVYKLFLKNGEWKAWDLVIDDLSTYLNYKEQFSKILKTKTIAQLTEVLEKKAVSSMNDYLKKNKAL